MLADGLNPMTQDTFNAFVPTKADEQASAGFTVAANLKKRVRWSLAYIPHPQLAQDARSTKSFPKGRLEES
jgi:hypothetical protein